MLDRNGFEKWVAENGTGHVVRKHFNGMMECISPKCRRRMRRTRIAGAT